MSSRLSVINNDNAGNSVHSVERIIRTVNTEVTAKSYTGSANYASPCSSLVSNLGAVYTI